MTEMVTSGSMSGEGKRSDGLLGEGDDESRRLLQAPPVLHVTAPLPDSTVVVDSPQKRTPDNTADRSANFCRVAPPWSAGTQVRLSGILPLPGGVRLSGTYQNIRGISTTATVVAGNAVIAPTLGRNLSGGANATRTIEVIEPESFLPEDGAVKSTSASAAGSRWRVSVWSQHSTLQSDQFQ
jgi:hypothetical protein